MAITADTELRLGIALKNQGSAKELIDQINDITALTPGVFPSSSGAVSIGTATTDTTTIIGLLREQASNAVTAFATGGKTSATQLTGNLNRISVCATAGDSVKLPASAAGLVVYVLNDGAAAAQVFGAGTDTINSIATATGVAQGVGVLAVYVCTAAGNWRGEALNKIEVNTAISTVGAGTLTAAGIVGGLITRSGSTAAYTDTTATAAQIVAAIGVTRAGATFRFTIKNTVAFAETLAGGTGITLSGLTVVPPLSVANFLVTVTSVSAVAIVGIDTQPLCNLPATQFTTIATDTTITAAAGALTGASHVVYQTTAAGAGGIALTTRTAAEMFGDIPNCQIGTSFLLTLVSQGGGTVTLTAGSNVTITGTATVATKTTRTFVCTFTSAAAITMQSVSKGSIE